MGGSRTPSAPSFSRPVPAESRQLRQLLRREHLPDFKPEACSFLLKICLQIRNFFLFSCHRGRIRLRGGPKASELRHFRVELFPKRFNLFQEASFYSSKPESERIAPLSDPEWVEPRLPAL